MAKYPRAKRMREQIDCSECSGNGYCGYNHRTGENFHMEFESYEHMMECESTAKLPKYLEVECGCTA